MFEELTANLTRAACSTYL